MHAACLRFESRSCAKFTCGDLFQPGLKRLKAGALCPPTSSARDMQEEDGTLASAYAAMFCSSDGPLPLPRSQGAVVGISIWLGSIVYGTTYPGPACSGTTFATSAPSWTSLADKKPDRGISCWWPMVRPGTGAVGPMVRPCLWLRWNGAAGIAWLMVEPGTGAGGLLWVIHGALRAKGSLVLTS